MESAEGEITSAGRRCILALVALALTLGGCGKIGLSGADATSVAPAGEVNTGRLMEEGPLGEWSLGKADAPVTIIEYASMTCPHCRAFHLNTFPKLKSAYIDTGKVRFVIREFPIGHMSGAAAIVIRCAPEPKRLALFGRYFAEQKDWVSQEVRPDALFAVAAKSGMSRSTFDSCLTNQSILEGLTGVKQRGRELGVMGTPTFFINGRKERGEFTFEQMKAFIEPSSS